MLTRLLSFFQKTEPYEHISARQINYPESREGICCGLVIAKMLNKNDMFNPLETKELREEAAALQTQTGVCLKTSQHENPSLECVKPYFTQKGYHFSIQDLKDTKSETLDNSIQQLENDAIKDHCNRDIFIDLRYEDPSWWMKFTRWYAGDHNKYIVGHVLHHRIRSTSTGNLSCTTFDPNEGISRGFEKEGCSRIREKLLKNRNNYPAESIHLGIAKGNTYTSP